MIHCPNIDSIRAQVAEWKSASQSVAFVPTMGNLHDGHIALVNRARQLADHVVVSIFVNPLQFNEDSDFDAYPRTLEQDCLKLQAANTDALFIPQIEDIYPHGEEKSTKVIVPDLSEILEGQHRPGHFNGVSTVVNKLFNIVQADLACFGEKDFQQLMLIRRMVNELNMSISIEAVPTVRDADGLAMSSRNNRLDNSLRNSATALYQGLCEIKHRMEQGDRDYPRMEQDAAEFIQQQGPIPEYVAIRRSYDLKLPVEGDKQLVVLVAARLGDVRLIDNIPLNL